MFKSYVFTGLNAFNIDAQGGQEIPGALWNGLLGHLLMKWNLAFRPCQMLGVLPQRSFRTV